LGDAPVRRKSDLERLLQKTAGATTRAMLVREGQSAAITVRLRSFSAPPTRTPPPGPIGEAVRLEIERLERRIERLRRELGDLENVEAGDDR